MAKVNWKKINNWKVGDIVNTYRPFKIYRVNSDNTFEGCDDDGNCLTLTKQETIKSHCNDLKQNTNMKAMKDAVLTVAKQLAKANNTVTTLEIKTELRRDYPYYYWTQQTVSDYMSQLAGDGIFTYTDNGTYRIYSLAKPTVVNTAPAVSGGVSTSASTTLMKISGKIATNPASTSTPKVSSIRTGRNVTKAQAYGLAGHPKFESVTISGKIVTKRAIREQKKSPLGYLTNSKLNKLTSITVNGKTYKVK